MEMPVFYLNLVFPTDGWLSGDHDGASVVLSYPIIYPNHSCYFYDMIYGPICVRIYYAFVLCIVVNVVVVPPYTHAATLVARFWVVC